MTNQPSSVPSGLARFVPLFNGISLAALLVMCGACVLAYPKLPEIIPHHYNAVGTPDAWGSRMLIFTLPAFGLALYWLLGSLARHPTTLNYPSLPADEAQREALYQSTRHFVYLMRTLVLLLFMFITLQTIRIAAGKAEGLPVLGIWLLVGLIVLSTGYMYVRQRQLRN